VLSPTPVDFVAQCQVFPETSVPDVFPCHEVFPFAVEPSDAETPHLVGRDSLRWWRAGRLVFFHHSWCSPPPSDQDLPSIRVATAANPRLCPTPDELPLYQDFPLAEDPLNVNAPSMVCPIIPAEPWPLPSHDVPVAPFRYLACPGHCPGPFSAPPNRYRSSFCRITVTFAGRQRPEIKNAPPRSPIGPRSRFCPVPNHRQRRKVSYASPLVTQTETPVEVSPMVLFVTVLPSASAP